MLKDIKWLLVLPSLPVMSGPLSCQDCLENVQPGLSLGFEQEGMYSSVTGKGE